MTLRLLGNMLLAGNRLILLSSQTDLVFINKEKIASGGILLCLANEPFGCCGKLTAESEQRLCVIPLRECIFVAVFKNINSNYTTHFRAICCDMF